MTGQECAELLSCATDPATRDRLERFIRSNSGHRIYIPTATLINAEATATALKLLAMGEPRSTISKRLASTHKRSRRWAYEVIARALDKRRGAVK